MSGNQRGRVPAELWFLEQAIVWIETRTSVPKHQIPRQIAPTTMQELYQALKAGVITASGCVDGSERRDISHGEWNDYRLELKYTKFPNHYFTGSGGTPIIAVLSIRSFPAAALRYHGYPSGVWVPSASTQDGDPGYHRVITDVLLLREEVIRQWPGIGQVSSSQDCLRERGKSRPCRVGRADRRGGRFSQALRGEGGGRQNRSTWLRLGPVRLFSRPGAGAGGGRHQEPRSG
jgi:hypothetical protein